MASGPSEEGGPTTCQGVTQVSLNGTSSSDRRDSNSPVSEPPPNGSGPAYSKHYIDEDSLDERYKSDDWRINNFKIVPCDKRFSHDWTFCPKAHPGEKARRRDLRVFKYDGIACQDMKKFGCCKAGDQCCYAHNVFEYWMHPSRYRTQFCNDGANCKRHACFFAHSPEELRCNEMTKATALLERSKGYAGFGDVSPRKKDSQKFSPPRNQNSAPPRSISLPRDEVNFFEVPDGDRSASVDLSRTSGSSSNQVAQMFSQLLRNGLEGPQVLPPPANPADLDSAEYQASIMKEIKALSPAEVQHMLKLVRGQFQQHQSPESHLQGELLKYHQNAQAASFAGRYPIARLSNREVSSFAGNPRRRNSSLHTAPAGLESFMSQTNGLSHNGGSVMSQDYMYNQGNQNRMMSGELASGGNQPRMFSGEVGPGGMGGMLTGQSSNAWQSGAFENLQNLRRLSGQLSDTTRVPSSNVIARMSLDASQYPQSHGLYPASSSTSSHTMSALHSQPFRLEDATVQQNVAPPLNSQMNRPVASAFQQLSAQDWTAPPGRGLQNELNWRYSGNVPSNLPSGDLSRISEDLAAASIQHIDEYNRSVNNGWVDMRSRSVGVPGLNSYENTREALHAANGQAYLSTAAAQMTQANVAALALAQGPPHANSLHSGTYDLNPPYAGNLQSMGNQWKY